MGTPPFAVPSLQTLHREQYPILAVVTAAEKPRGRGRKQSSTAVGEYALTHRLPLLSPASLRDPEFLRTLQELRPDLLVVVAFRILPPEILRIPRVAAFNLHASLLPAYRGAAPINRAIMNGETMTGLTTFALAEKVDTGGIILQRPHTISPDDDAGSLHDRLSTEGSGLVLETVRMLEAGGARPIPQDNSRATAAPKIRKEDCRIEWDRPAMQIHNQIRGLSPSPGAYSTHNGKILKIFRSLPTHTPATDPPGSVIIKSGTIHVATADFIVSIEEIQQEGRKRMTAGEFLRGYNIEDLERLG